MNKIPYPADVDLEKFDETKVELEAKYGLPQDVQFCTHCVMTNQRPNSAKEYVQIRTGRKKTLNFDTEGVCDACRVKEVKAKTNWEEREQMLWELCDKYRRDDGQYDCIVSGSGGKDSFYQSHILRYKFKMHPLTVTWAPHIYTDWGWRNFQAWIHSGFDNYLFTPNGRVHRLLTRLSVDNLLYPFHPFVIGQKAFAPKLAITLNVPLIFYGEDEAEYGNKTESKDATKEETGDAIRDYSYFTSDNRTNMTLAGIALDDLNNHFDLSNNDIAAYLPGNPADMEKAKIQVHYLGYYLKWHPQSCYYYAVEHGGFEASPERTPGTYSKYSGIDDKLDDWYYYTYHVKFGLGRASENASQEVRSGDIFRDEAVALVKKYDGEWPSRFEKDFYDYISLSEAQFPVASKMFEQPIVDKEYFMKLCNSFRSPHLWKKENGEWKQRHFVWMEESEASDV